MCVGVYFLGGLVENVLDLRFCFLLKSLVEDVFVLCIGIVFGIDNLAFWICEWKGCMNLKDRF